MVHSRKRATGGTDRSSVAGQDRRRRGESDRTRTGEIQDSWGDDSWTPAGSHVDNPRDIEAREFLMKGFTASNGQQIPESPKQTGPSCHPSAIVTGWKLMGWDVAPQTNFIERFPSDLITRIDTLDETVRKRILSRYLAAVGLPQHFPAHNLSGVRLLHTAFGLDDVIDAEQDRNVRRYSRKICRKYGINSESTSITDMQSMQYFVKGILSLLMADQKKRLSERNPGVRAQISSSQKAGEQLLSGALDHNQLKLHSVAGQANSSATHRLVPLKQGRVLTIPELKQKFVQIIKQTKPPVTLSYLIGYNPDGGDIECCATSHTVIIYGIKRDGRNGGTTVKIKDSRDDGTKMRSVTLDKFVSAVHAPTLRSHGINITNAGFTIQALPDAGRQGLKAINTADWTTPKDVLGIGDKASIAFKTLRKRLTGHAVSQTTAKRELALRKLRSKRANNSTKLSSIFTKTAGVHEELSRLGRVNAGLERPRSSEERNPHTNTQNITSLTASKQRLIEKYVTRHQKLETSENTLAQLVVSAYLHRIRARNKARKNNREVV